MDSMDGTNGMDNMDTIEFGQPGDTSCAAAGGAPDPAGKPGREKWSGKTKRLVTSVAASAVLLGSGAAIGVALTGGASASTGGTSPGTAANTSATTMGGAGRCAKLVERLTANGNATAAKRLGAFCKSPLVRLALVGGAHGEVTIETKAGPKTIAVERGTIQSVSNAGITVVAKDGTTWAWDFVASTVVRDDQQAVGRNQLSNGETVLILGQVVGGVHDARLIRVHG
jgi:hypothetical protein